MVAFDSTVDILVLSLEGDDRLISGTTIAGIIAFIIGNGLQFWATFDPGH